MKRLLVGAAALATAFVLSACSGGGSTASGANVAAAAATSSAVPTTSVPATTSATPTTPPAPTTSTPAAKPKPKPAPPKAQPAVVTADVPCAAAAAAHGVSACVDLSAHKAWLLQDGKIIYGPVAMLPGRKGYPTPAGTFHVLSREKVHLSKEFDNAPMRNSVFFYPGDAFHTGSLSVYSHGCIHLSATSSLKFFNTLAVGNVVQVVR